MTKKQVDELIEGIYDGSITEYNIPEALYFMIADRLRKGLYEGFGQTLSNVVTEDKALLTALRTNVYQFSAAKSYQEVKAMSGLLAEKQVFSEFKKEAKAKYDVFNDTYLKTEYDTAIGQAQMVVKWQEIEKTKDVLPFLRYSAIVDPNTSEICLPLDGVVAPVDDPIWDKILPLNHFNCRCVVLQEFDAVPTEGRAEIAEKVEGDMQDMFKQNPAKTGMIFDKSHPYYKVASEDREFARQNFGLPIPKSDEND